MVMRSDGQRHTADRIRCLWAGDDPAMIRYHDEEWGVPTHDEREWFEMLTLEGFQAGLSWRTVLHKRVAFRRAFDDFHPERVARFGGDDVASLLADPRIIRNRAKIEASVANAQAFLEIQAEFGSFNAYIWRFVGGAPIVNRWARMEEVPSETEVSQAISRDLKSRGFKFVGPTICYALMQATGLVNDHLVDCFRHSELIDS